MANDFYLDFNVTGDERKRLVQAIAGYTQVDAQYLGAPSFAYQVDYFTIDRNGVVSFDDRADSEEIEGLIEALAEQGFVSQVSNLGCAEVEETHDEEQGGELVGLEALAAAGEQDDETDVLVTQMPIESFTEEALNNLHALVAAKGRLIRKALDTEHLPILVEDDIVSLPWVSGRRITDEEAGAYIHLISAICDMARNQKRITAKEKATDNDKYAFRCFLLRLGFIGPEYKEERKILLRNLSGNSAFKSVTPQEDTDAVSG